MVDICRNCGVQVGMWSVQVDGEYKLDLRHSATRSVWCDVLNSNTITDKSVEMLSVESLEDAISYRNVLLYGAEAIPIPNPKDIQEEPSYMMFARANVRENIPSSVMIVKELVARIDRLETEKKERGYNGG